MTSKDKLMQEIEQLKLLMQYSPSESTNRMLNNIIVRLEYIARSLE